MSLKERWLDFTYWLDDRKEFFREWRERGFIHFICPVCDGDGGEDSWEDDYGWSEPWECNYCHGTGWIGLWKRLLSANSWFLDGTINNVFIWWHERKVKP